MSCMGFAGLVWWRALVESVPSPWGWAVPGVMGPLALIGLGCVVSWIWDHLPRVWAAVRDLLSTLWLVASPGVALLMMVYLTDTWPVDPTMVGFFRCFGYAVIAAGAWSLWLVLGVLISALISAWIEYRRQPQ